MSTYGYFKHDEMSGYAIAHHGILGQKWGVRRYQNEDGSLTEAGKKRYTKSDGVLNSRAYGEGIDTEGYYNNLAKSKGIKRTISPYKSKSQGQKFSLKTAINDLSKMVIRDNEELGLTGKDTKWYSSEQVEEYLISNYKGYDDLPDEKRFDLQEKLAKELDKKGFHWID